MGGSAHKTYRQAKESHARMTSGDTEMSDAGETSHAERLENSRKRAFDSYDGPRR